MLLIAPLALMVGCADDATGPTEPMIDAPVQLSTTAKFGRGSKAGALGPVYVSSQGLYYDTFVSASSLPQHGPFQRIYNGVTEFGPGQQEYVGGRWWVDNNNNFIMDEGDAYLLCPLLGPGRETP